MPHLTKSWLHTDGKPTTLENQPTQTGPDGPTGPLTFWASHTTAHAFLKTHTMISKYCAPSASQTMCYRQPISIDPMNNSWNSLCYALISLWMSTVESRSTTGNFHSCTNTVAHLACWYHRLAHLERLWEPAREVIEQMK